MLVGKNEVSTPMLIGKTVQQALKEASFSWFKYSFSPRTRGFRSS